MKITETRLRRIIRDEMRRLQEDATSDTGGSAGSASKLTDQQKKKLQAFADQPPSSLSSFSASLKTLGAILGEIDEKAANLNSAQIKMYFTQIMQVVDAMMSEKKTSSSETSKVGKALGVD